MKVFIILSALVIFPLAWARGGSPERWVASILVAAYVATYSLQFWFLGRVQIGVGLVDLVVWIAFVSLALKYDRWWLVLAAAAQTLSLTAHPAMYLTPDLHLRDNVAVQMVFTIVSLYALLLGVLERRLAGEVASPLRWPRLRFPQRT